MRILLLSGVLLASVAVPACAPMPATPATVGGGVGFGAVVAEKKSKAGESCLKSADCEGALGCIDSKCKTTTRTTDASGAADGGTGPEDVATEPDAAGQEVESADSAGCTPKCPSMDCQDGCGGSCAGTCEDGNLCTSGDHCEAGACKPAATVLCQDGNECTFDGCAAAAGCVFTPSDGAACSDGNPCTGDGTCEGENCNPGSPTNCDDKNPCTSDVCDGAGGDCKHAPVDGTCGSGGKCVSGACLTCPPGKAIGAGNVCVSAVGCEGKCGAASKDGAGKQCFCDDVCADPKYNDCCADKPKWCGDGKCKPKDKQGCCGKDLCWFDSCGKQDPESALPCEYGCNATANACATDPCMGVPVEGVCLGTKSAYTYCSVPTGNQQPTVEMEFCSPIEECKVVDGTAQCVELPGYCDPGDMQCDAKNPDQSRVCDANGVWQAKPCAACKYSAIGPTCPGKVATVAYTGTFSFEYQLPNAGKTDWTSTPEVWHPVGAIVFSKHAEPSQAPQIIDADYVAADGTVTLQVAKAPGALDSIVLMAATAEPLSMKLKYAVVIPDTADGEQKLGPQKPLKVWSWAWPVSILTPTFAVTVPAAQSAALNVYYTIHGAMEATFQQYGYYGDSLIVWLRMNTTWSCGKCVWPVSTEAFGNSMKQQMFIGASALDQSYWSDAVNAHEAGHWVMGSYGKSPGEGGTHFLGNPTFPGQAWSEGWATYFSSLLRDDTVQTDKQGGGFFWYDIGINKYGSGKTWQKPTLSGGLLQKTDENHVAAMLWSMTSTETKNPIYEPDNARFFEALASDAMTKPWIIMFSPVGYAAAAYGRAYFRTLWQVAANGTFYDEIATNFPAPMFADMLDALMCLKAPAKPMPGWLIDLSVGDYPFPTATPMCPKP